MPKSIERVIFRLLRCQFCGFLICWVNPRLPIHCPECGKVIFPEIKQHVLKFDENAILTLEG